ncbi:hypothetical protein QYE76_044759 [Lolium multiflorum]|uniref:Uncharacterized protein n=1 Tax=Lolium multiflorum TaxID=4521 RepID=A0AAD8WZ61_LOLMU|nr:hypothetical protein QYE76_044759 [Lolium multiflorum]
MSGLRQPFSDLKFVNPSETGDTDTTEWALNYIKEKAPKLLLLVACSEVFDSSKGGTEKMCHEMGVPFLGKREHKGGRKRQRWVTRPRLGGVRRILRSTASGASSLHAGRRGYFCTGNEATVAAGVSDKR